MGFENQVGPSPRRSHFELLLLAPGLILTAVPATELFVEWSTGGPLERSTALPWSGYGGGGDSLGWIKRCPVRPHAIRMTASLRARATLAFFLRARLAMASA